MRERILAMKEIWTKDEAEYHGEYVNFDPIWSWPKPVQKPHPPILVGGDGRKVSTACWSTATSGSRTGSATRRSCSRGCRSFSAVRARRRDATACPSPSRSRSRARRRSSATRPRGSRAPSSGCRRRRRTWPRSCSISGPGCRVGRAAHSLKELPTTRMRVRFASLKDLVCDGLPNPAAIAIRARALADRQHGVVARHQMLELGFSSQSIKHRIARGRLHPVWRGVYAVGRPQLTLHGRWMAAVLSCGPRPSSATEPLRRSGRCRPVRGDEIEISVPGDAKLAAGRASWCAAGRRSVQATSPDATQSR